MRRCGPALQPKHPNLVTYQHLLRKAHFRQCFVLRATADAAAGAHAAAERGSAPEQSPRRVATTARPQPRVRQCRLFHNAYTSHAVRFRQQLYLRRVELRVTTTRRRHVRDRRPARRGSV